MTNLLSNTPTQKFARMVNSGDKIGVSEFSRSKAWRAKLRKKGCFEIIDRGETVGYLLSPEYAKTISDKIVEAEALAEAEERAAALAMFDARQDRNNLLTGKALENAVEQAFSERIDALMDVVNDNN